jgi:hypothetical protein
MKLIEAARKTSHRATPIRFISGRYSLGLFGTGRSRYTPTSSSIPLCSAGSPCRDRLVSSEEPHHRDRED